MYIYFDFCIRTHVCDASILREALFSSTKVILFSLFNLLLVVQFDVIL